MADLEDDDDDEGSEPSGGGGALSQLLTPQTSTAEAKADSNKIIQKYLSGDYQEDERPILKGIQDNAESIKQALRDAQTKLQGMQITPRENQLAMAQAWLAPSRTGRFGDTLSSVAGEQAKQIAQQRELDQQKALSGLDFSKQVYGVDQKTLDAQLALQKLHEQSAGPIVSQALRTEAAPDKASGAGTKYQLKKVDLGQGKFQYQAFDPANPTKLTPVGSVTDNELTIPDDIAESMAMYETPGVTASRSPKYQLAANEAAMAHARLNGYEWSPVVSNQVAQNAKYFGNGGKGNEAIARGINVGMQHLSLLDQASREIGHPEGSMPALNQLADFFKVQTGNGSPQVVYDSIKQKVAAEVTQAAVASGGGVSERIEQAQNLNKKYSDPIHQDITNGYRSLFEGNYKALKNQFYSGSGLNEIPPTSDLYNKKKALVDRRWASMLLPQTREAFDPAPAAAYAILKAHPETAPQFKARYGYLPGAQ